MIDVTREIRYEDILDTAAEVHENENIAKEGLTLLYHLSPQRHKDLDEHLFYKTTEDPNNVTFEHKDIIRMTVGEVKFMFIRNDKEIILENIEENE